MADQGTTPEVEQTTEAAPTTETPQEQAQPDLLADVTSRLDQLSRSHEDLTRLLQDQVQPQYEPDGYDPYGQPQPEAFDANDPQAFSQAVQQAVQQQLAPFQQERYVEQINGLMEKYPALKTDGQVASTVMDQAREWTQLAGGDPRSNPSPRLIEAAYKLHQADQIAAQQRPVSENLPPQLEPSGASPQQPEEDIAAQIKAAASGSNFLTR